MNCQMNRFASCPRLIVILMFVFAGSILPFIPQLQFYIEYDEHEYESHEVLTRFSAEQVNGAENTNADTKLINFAVAGK